MADDPYRIADQVDSNMLEMMASRLEGRDKDTRLLGMIEDYLEPISVTDAQQVLDLGCGTGFVARRIAGQDGFSGHVTGIGRSPQLVAKARDLATSGGLSPKTTFGVGDTRQGENPVC